MERIKNMIKLPDPTDHKVALIGGIIYIIGFTGVAVTQVGTVTCKSPYIVEWTTPVAICILLSGAFLLGRWSNPDTELTE